MLIFVAQNSQTLESMLYRQYQCDPTAHQGQIHTPLQTNSCMSKQQQQLHGHPWSILIMT
jgi:hypothetical protein